MKQLIWDVPTRLFHAAFAGSILTAFALGKFASEHSPLFVLHIFFGALAGVLLVWRVFWGFAGTKHVRFGALLFSPARIVEYFSAVLKGRGQYFAGHNPGGSLSVWAMLALAAVTVASGLSMGFLGETFEEIHEISSILLIGVAAVHVCGVLLASYMHQESYALAMITGKKAGQPSDAIQGSRMAAALVLSAAIGGIGLYIFQGLDLKNGSFTAPGTSFSIQFMENENETENETESESENEAGGEEDDEDHDDD